MPMFSSSKHNKGHGRDSDDDHHRSHSYSGSSPDYRSSHGRNSSYDNHYSGKGNHYKGSSGYNKKNKLHEYQTVVLRTQFHCDGCVRKVKNAINNVKGVESVDVDERRDRVTVSGYIDPHKVRKKVSDTGKYVEIENISASNFSGSDHKHNKSTDFHRDDNKNRNRNHYDNNRGGSDSYYHYEDEYPRQGYNRGGNYYSDYNYQEDNSGCSIM